MTEKQALKDLLEEAYEVFGNPALEGLKVYSLSPSVMRDKGEIRIKDEDERYLRYFIIVVKDRKTGKVKLYRPLYDIWREGKKLLAGTTNAEYIQGADLDEHFVIKFIVEIEGKLSKSGNWCHVSQYETTDIREARRFMKRIREVKKFIHDIK